MANFNKISKTLILAAAFSGASTGASLIPNFANTGSVAFAQQAAATRPDRPPRKTLGFSERIYKVLSKAQEAMGAEPPRFDEAMAILKEQNLERINDTERASFYQMMAAVTQQQEKYKEALGYYEKILAIQNISYTLEDQIKFAAGQLHFLEGNYDQAIKFMEEWLLYQDDPPVRNLVFVSNAYYSAGAADGVPKNKADDYFKTALSYILTVIKRSEEEGIEVKENYYTFLRTLYYNLGDTAKVLETVELLATRWPKKEYWTQLSGLYAQKAAEDGTSEAEALALEKKQMAAYELAYRQNMLETGRELETMAQLYLYHNVPYKAAKTVEASLNKGLSEKNQKNYNLLAQALINGKDTKDSIEPLKKAAELSDDGNLYVRLGQVYISLDMYDEAADAIGKGLAKGGISRPDQTSFMQGQAYMSVMKFDEARKSFREAAKDKRSEKTANSWISYLDNEEKRYKQIQEYLS